MSGAPRHSKLPTAGSIDWKLGRRTTLSVPTQVREEKLKHREEFRNKRAQTGNELGQQKSNVNRSSFQQKQKGPAPSSASAHAPRSKCEFQNQNSQNFRAKPGHSHGSMTQRGIKTPAFSKCGWSHSGYGNGNGGNRAQSSLVVPPDGAASRSATGAGGGGNHLYAITSCQGQEDSSDIFTCTIQVFKFDVYALSLSSVTPFVALNFDVLLEKLLEPFSVSTLVGEFILVQRVYRDCTIYVNHKSTMADLVECDMVYFDVILRMD
uniref:Polyprotein n=1 Tax=Solanum tuberosum TaxID=4113 RepID=M1DV54_SOLTU